VSAPDRAAFLLEAHALAKAGLLSAAELVRLLSAYAMEEDSVVWDAISSVLTGMEKVLQPDEKVHAHFVTLAASLVDPAMARLGWEASPSDGHLTKLQRSAVISLLTQFSKSDEILNEARRRFEAVVEDITDVKSCPTDYRVAVFSLVASKGGKKEYDQLMSIYHKSDTDAQRKQVMHSIGSVPDVKLKIAALDWATSGTVKLQDFFYIFGSGMRWGGIWGFFTIFFLVVGGSDKVGAETVWNYFTTNFARIRGMLAKANPTLTTAVIANSARNFVTRGLGEGLEIILGGHG